MVLHLQSRKLFIFYFLRNTTPLRKTCQKSKCASRPMSRLSSCIGSRRSNFSPRPTPRKRPTLHEVRLITLDVHEKNPTSSVQVAIVVPVPFFFRRLGKPDTQTHGEHAEAPRQSSSRIRKGVQARNPSMNVECGESLDFAGKMENISSLVVDGAEASTADSSVMYNRTIYILYFNGYLCNILYEFQISNPRVDVFFSAAYRKVSGTGFSK